MDVQAALAENMLTCMANPQAKSGQLCSMLFLSFFSASCRHSWVSLDQQMCMTPMINETSTYPCIHGRGHNPDCPPRLVCNCRSSTARAASSATHVQQHEDKHKAKAGSELQLHNTMGRRKQTFQPRPSQGQDVSMYVCGVTVYDW